MNATGDIELRILSRPNHLCVARATVATAVLRLGFDEATCGQIELAVDEALTNIIRHGYRGRDDQPIWLRFTATGSNGCPAFELVIDDLAEQIDPSHIRGRDLDDIRPGGLGVHIIHRIMDQVCYSPRPGGGMRLTMRKAAARETTPSTTTTTQQAGQHG